MAVVASQSADGLISRPACAIAIPVPMMSPNPMFTDSGLASSVYGDECVPDMSADQLDGRTSLLRLSTQYLSSEEALSPTDDACFQLDHSDTASIASFSSLVEGEAVKVEIARFGAAQIVSIRQHIPAEPAVSVGSASDSLFSASQSSPNQLSSCRASIVSGKHSFVDPLSHSAGSDGPAITLTADLTHISLAASPAGSSSDLTDPTYDDYSAVSCSYPSSEATKVSQSSSAKSSSHGRSKSTVNFLRNRSSISAVLRLSRPRVPSGSDDSSSFVSASSSRTDSRRAMPPPPVFLSSSASLARAGTSESFGSSQLNLSPSHPELKGPSRTSGRDRFRKVSRSILAAVTLSSNTSQVDESKLSAPLHSGPVMPASAGIPTTGSQTHRPGHSRRISWSFNKTISSPSRPTSSAFPPAPETPVGPSTRPGSHDRRTSIANLGTFFTQRRHNHSDLKPKLGQLFSSESPKKGPDGFFFRRPSHGTRASTFFLSRTDISGPIDSPIRSSQTSMLNLASGVSFSGPRDHFSAPNLARPATSSASMAMPPPPPPLCRMSSHIPAFPVPPTYVPSPLSPTNVCGGFAQAQPSPRRQASTPPFGTPLSPVGGSNWRVGTYPRGR